MKAPSTARIEIATEGRTARLARLEWSGTLAPSSDSTRRRERLAITVIGYALGALTLAITAHTYATLAYAAGLL